MIKNFIVIDDAIDNVYEFVELSKKLEYHSTESFFIEGIKQNHNIRNKPPPYWRGYRSDPIYQIDNELHIKTMNQIIYKIFGLYYFKYIAQTYIHKTSKFLNNEQNTNKWHRDSENSIFAGVIFLNQNPPKNSGTSLEFDNKIISIKNQFNRLILYKSNINHSPDNFFGDNIDNCRTTLTFFINELTINGKFND